MHYLKFALGVGIAAAVALDALIGAPVLAKDVLGSKPWDFEQRGTIAATTKAMSIWRTENAGGAASGGGAGGADSGLGGSGGGGGTAIANYSDIDIIFGENSQGQVMINTDQDSTGDQTSETVGVTNYTDTVNMNAGGAPSGP